MRLLLKIKMAKQICVMLPDRRPYPCDTFCYLNELTLSELGQHRCKAKRLTLDHNAHTIQYATRIINTSMGGNSIQKELMALPRTPLPYPHHDLLLGAQFDGWGLHDASSTHVNFALEEGLPPCVVFFFLGGGLSCYSVFMLFVYTSSSITISSMHCMFHSSLKLSFDSEVGWEEHLNTIRIKCFTLWQ